MITDFLITVLYNVVALVANLFAVLPDVALNGSIVSSINSISPYYAGINTVFPIDTLVDILAVELLFIGAYFTYKLIRWGYTKIPGVN